MTTKLSPSLELSPDVAGNGRADRPPVLALEDVSVVLGGRSIVEHLDLTVHHGEMVSILGPSGCGKTTTLRVIAGFVRPKAGRVLIEGSDVGSLGPERRPTAMVFQNYALWPHMSVSKNLTFGLRAQGLSRREASERALAALELVGLAHAATRTPVNLSGGEQQRVALARALVVRPSLLLLDEPLSNLDAQLRVRVRDELVDLQRRTGVSMILVTHDQDEALSVSDRVAVMHEGRLEQLDHPSALYRRPATSFVAGFVGRVNEIPVVLDASDGTLRLAPASPGSIGAVLGRLAETEARSVTADSRLQGLVRPEDVVLEPARPGSPDLKEASLEGSVSRVVARGHFDESVVETALGTLRSYGPPAVAGKTVAVRFRRVLLYANGKLVSALEAGVGR